VRGQDHVVEARETLGHVRLVGEDVETRGTEPAVRQQLDERRLVDQPAAGDVDEHALRSERLEHLAADDHPAPGRTRGTEEQDVARPSELDGTRHGLPGYPAFGLRIVIGNCPAEASEPAGERLADPTQAQDAVALAPEALAERHAAQEPFAGAHVAVGLGDPSAGGHAECDREIGHVVEQDGRGRDDDPARLGRGKVGRLEADPVDGADLELRQGVDQALGQAGHAAREEPADFVRVRCQVARPVLPALALEDLVDDEAPPLELLEDEGLLVADRAQVDRHDASARAGLPAAVGIE